MEHVGYPGSFYPFLEVFHLWRIIGKFLRRQQQNWYQILKLFMVPGYRLSELGACQTRRIGRSQTPCSWICRHFLQRWWTENVRFWRMGQRMAQWYVDDPSRIHHWTSLCHWIHQAQSRPPYRQNQTLHLRSWLQRKLRTDHCEVFRRQGSHRLSRCLQRRKLDWMRDSSFRPAQEMLNQSQLWEIWLDYHFSWIHLLFEHQGWSDYLFWSRPAGRESYWRWGYVHYSG